MRANVHETKLYISDLQGDLIHMYTLYRGLSGRPPDHRAYMRQQVS